jgi:ribosomal-protein-serine acetyltransferase
MNPILLDIPSEFSTLRLTLRISRPGDSAIAYRVVRESLPELKQWMPWATEDFTLEKHEEWCRRAAGEFINREALHFRIFLKEDSAFLGTISADTFNWDIPRCEIGYWLGTSHYGRGFMTEAASGLIEMLKESVRPIRIEIRCDSLNQKSRRVAERLRFDLEAVLRAHERRKDGTLRDTCIYALVDRANVQQPSLSELKSV